jgi:hypothetical protein
MVRVFESADVAIVHSFILAFHFGVPRGKLKASGRFIHGFDLNLAVVPPICVTKLVTEEKIMTKIANPIAAGTSIGHVHLKVSNIQKSLDFYCGVLGFELQQLYGDQAAFVSAGGYHHHLGMNTWESLGAHRRRPALRDFSIRRSSIRRGPTWAMPCGGSRPIISRSTALLIMAFQKPCTCATRTRTELNSIGTGPRTSGRASLMAALP